MAEVGADLDLFRRGAAAGRLRPLCAALHHDPEIEVMPQTRERHSGLLRRDLRAGAMGLARRDALELVLLAALLAAHAEVAVHAAQRQAEAIDLLEPRSGLRLMATGWGRTPLFEAPGLLFLLLALGNPGRLAKKGEALFCKAHQK